MKALPVLAVVLLFASIPALASERGSVDEFVQSLAQVRADLEQEKPRPLSSKEWRLYDEAESQVRSLLSGKESVEELDQDQRVALINAQERMAAILAGAEDERMVCRRERRLGTNIRRATCVTVAQLREEKEAAQSAIRRLSQNVLRAEGEP